MEKNTIPSVIKNFTKDNKDSLITFLEFENWIQQNESKATDWIVVARNQKINDEEDYFTFSALASFSEENIQDILSTYEWDVDHNRFGRPTFYSNGNDEVYYESGQEENIKGINFKPFIYYRNFNGYIPNTFEIIQNFIIYHNAFFIKEKSAYFKIDNTGELIKVIDIKHEENNEVIKVDTHCLKDYLVANESCLVRYHDHRRKTAKDISSFISGDSANKSIKNEAVNYSIHITNCNICNGYCDSILLGKDIITPYNKLCNEELDYLLGNNKKFVKYVIGRDDSGNEIEEVCDENQLSSYFNDTGKVHFLTPVFFQRKVLNKYYQEPKIYAVDNTNISCLDFWSLPVDTTDEGLIQVWLGDLGRIPYKHQLHWKQYNVTPKGTITNERWQRDFMAQWTKSDSDPVMEFKRVFNDLQNKFISLYGEPLFKALDNRDKHTYDTLHLPTTDEWKEFDEQVQALAKVTSDSINVSVLSKITNLKIDGKEIKGSNQLLTAYLTLLKVEENDINEISLALNQVQSVRSSGSAHRKGENFDKALNKFELKELSNFDKIKKLLIALTCSLRLILDILNKE